MVVFVILHIVLQNCKTMNNRCKLSVQPRHSRVNFTQFPQSGSHLPGLSECFKSATLPFLVQSSC